MSDNLEKLKQRVAVAIFAAADDAHNTWPTPEHPECQRMADAAIRAIVLALGPDAFKTSEE